MIFEIRSSLHSLGRRLVIRTDFCLIPFYSPPANANPFFFAPSIFFIFNPHSTPFKLIFNPISAVHTQRHDLSRQCDAPHAKCLEGKGFRPLQDSFYN